MEAQKTIKNLWWTMRLWSYDAILQKWSLAEKLYKNIKISERHRHRYEVNIDFYNDLKNAWLIFSWLSPDEKLVEFIEIKKHNFFIATQAHPEFNSSLEKPHPLFLWLVNNCIL